MEQLWPSLVALLTTLVTIGGGYALTRRYRKMGVGPAEQLLSSTLQATMSAQAGEIATLRRQLDDAQALILTESKKTTAMALEFQGCKDRLVRLERLVADKALGETQHATSNEQADKRYRDAR